MRYRSSFFSSALLSLATIGWSQEYVAVETHQFPTGPTQVDVDENVVAISNWVAAGSPNRIHILFRNTFGDWIPEASIQIQGGSLSYAASLEGDWLAVGNRLSNTAADGAGEVQLWQRQTPGAWIMRDPLTTSDATEFDRFGTAVDIEEGVMVVGAPWKVTAGLVTGAAYVFELGPQGWQEVGRLAPPVVPSNMGGVVATDGEHILVSANDLVFVYEKQGGLWRNTGTFDVTPQSNQRVFSLDVHGPTAACGVRGFSNGRGAVMVFEDDGTSWLPTAILENPDGANGDRMGSSVSVQPDLIATGSPGDDFGQVNARGSVQLFARLGGDWQHVETIAPSGNVGEGFGGDVHLQGDELFTANLAGRKPRIYQVLPAHPATYCQSTENSTGLKATLWTQGSNSVSTNDLVLSAGPATDGALPASFFYGPGQTETPFSAGIICVGGPMHRLPVVALPDGLVYNLAVDLSSPPASPGSQILPGSTWNFQAWYRDFENGTPVINFSSATSLTFAP